MSNFLQSLVLRAAGLPPAASPLPRPMPAAEPLAAGPLLEEVSEEVSQDVAEDAAPEPSTAPRILEAQPPTLQPERIVEAPEAEGPRPLPEQQIFARASVRSEPESPHQIASEGPSTQVVTNVIEREVIHERQPVVERIEATPVVPPPPPAIRVPSDTLRETPVVTHEQERTAGSRESRTEPDTARPLLLQPIVIRETKTIVQPELRERETRVVETDSEPAAAESAEDEREEMPQRSRVALVEPSSSSRPVAHDLKDERSVDAGDPHFRPPLASPEPPPFDALPPAVLVRPAEPPPRLELDRRQPVSETTISIGTIEFRAPQPPPPAPPSAPAPVVITREPESPSGFDDYARLRSYTFPEVW